MNKQQMAIKILITAARPTAILAAAMGLMLLPGLLHRLMAGKDEWFTLMIFFSYAGFILLPVQRLSDTSFNGAMIVGGVLAVGSLVFSKVLLVEFGRGDTMSGAVFITLALPIYAYVPVRIWERQLLRRST